MVGTVLIVDADQGFTQPAQTALEAQGVTVHVREDAPIDFVRKLRPTVMMLNVELPSSTGFSICSRIRRDRELKQTPILLTSSEASAEALKKHAASSDRADDYARKPVALDDLVARISRLLANSPVTAAEPRSADAQVSAANGAAQAQSAVAVEPGDDLVAQLRMELDQPSEAPPPSAELKPPPPTGEMTRAAPARPAPDGAGPPPLAPPPLRREPPAAPPPATAEELWRPLRLEEALKSGLEIAEPPSPAKATPEERLAFLRQLVKYYEAKDKVFRDVWNTTQQQGVELARRAGALGVDLQNKERRLAEILQDRDQVHRRLQAVETELKTFQEEITRIFRDKDAEEQATLARMSALEQASSALSSELQSARAQNRDDALRLGIFQEEVGDLHALKDSAEAKIIELDRTLDEGRRENEELRARLSMTEDVASQRADEIEQLKERHDNLAIDADQDRRRLEDSHADVLHAAHAEAEAKMDARHKEHAQALQAMSEERAESIARLSSRHEEILATLSRTHESEVVAVEEERDQAQQRANELTTEVRVLEQKLRNAATERAAESGTLRADIEGLERGNRDLTEQLDLTATALESVQTDRDQLAARLESTEAELNAVRQQAEEIASMLDDERVAAANHAEELERIIETERSDNQRRIAALEEEVDAAQNEAFEQLAALERLKKSHEKLTARAHEVETTLKISEKALTAAESHTQVLEEELAGFKEEHAALQAHSADLEAVREVSESELERERDRVQRAEDLAFRAKEKIGELQRNQDTIDKRLRAESEELRKERALRAAYELEVESLREELTGKDERLSRAVSERTALKARDTEAQAKVEAMRRESQQIQSRFAALNAELETARRAKAELEAIERGGHAHIDSLERDLKALEATEEALLKEIDTRDDRILALEAAAESQQSALNDLEARLTSEQIQAQGLSAEHANLKDRHEDMMKRIVRALGAAHEALKREHPSKDQGGKDIPEYVGEIEPLEPTSEEMESLAARRLQQIEDGDSPWHVAQVPHTDTSSEDPFVALVAQLELEAAEAKADEDPAGRTAIRGGPFDEFFAHEATTTDGPSLDKPAGQALAGKSGLPSPVGTKKLKGPPALPFKGHDDEEGGDGEGDRNVTEIIQLEDLK